MIKLKEAAVHSFGISIASDVFKLEIQIMLEQIQLLESQLKNIEAEIQEIVSKQEN
ncbi:DUF5320 domain-containing protein [Enterococcus faecalis]|uniref:Phage protein n=1 Tax=Enterococcus faecalis RP2S-4 TaxID=1244145 RepID=A0ABC9TNZ4_ENTFL|nr:DUF5320 domain-containing protein [Enterococcus faecalis]EPI11644.1 hypothetical protein D358_00243 [Enterococcus faecalis RP2S-4]